MPRFVKSLVAISALSSIFLMPLVINMGKASALPAQKGTNANYVGAGVSVGVTNGGQNGDAATLGGNVSARLKLGNTPFSARGQVNFSDETAAIIPYATVDLPIARGTNMFFGGGYQFVESDGKPTPSGNKDSVAVVAGVESEVAKNFLIYSNATVGLDAYKNTNVPSLSVNTGLGIRF
ncbi:histidine kinase [Calothrix sp. 336/3]|uniref:histidine kinase n=1 Tax=Calothrix sp. 336/3 TaxID=1337936 RepID=UPI0004E341AC|nr:histidine kinase [Calothrix sp. 336/3]AKG22897.1 histidine kinase [Calothrix sp. 336/3]